MKATVEHAYVRLSRQHFEMAIQLQILEMQKGARYMLSSPLNKKFSRLEARYKKAGRELLRSIDKSSASLNP